MAADALEVAGGAGAVPAHPPWRRSCVAAWCALIAGPLVGLAVVLISTEISAVVAGWPSDGSETSGLWEVLPRIGGVWDVLGPVVFGLAWYTDASVRRWLFRRLAWADISLSAALVSTPLVPGLWLFYPPPGFHFSHGAWLWPVIVGPVFLRWRARSSEEGRRLELGRPLVAVLLLVVAVGGVCGVVLARQTHLTAPMYASVGLRPSTNGGYAVRTHEPLPLKALLGRDHLARTAYYDFTLGNSSPIPITITSAGVTYTGPAITAASAGFVDSIGASPGHEAGSVTVSRGADVNVRITLQLRACPANSAGAVSAVPSIRLHYRALGLTGTARLASRDPLELSCP